MSSYQAGEGQGPSWGDIREMIDHLGEDYGGVVVVELCGVPSKAGRHPRGLWARCVYRPIRERTIGPETTSGGLWPTPGHRTMPSLLYRLLTELERKLEDLRHDRAMSEQIQGATGERALLTYQHPLPTEKGD